MRNWTSLLLIAFILTACADAGAPPPAAYPYDANTAQQAADFAAQATRGARQQADSAATYQAAIARQTATADHATRVSQQATARAASIATGTAQAYAAARAATSDALAFRATEQTQNARATQAHGQMVATATAVAQVAAFEATLAADEARRLDLQRQADLIRLQSASLWNRAWPILLTLIVTAASFAGGLYMLNWWRLQTPVRHVANGDGYTLVTPHYRLLPPGEGRQPPALPAPRDAEEDPVLLPRFTQGHVLVAGETGSGKSNALRALLRHRQNVVVLDPHDEPGAWGGHTVIGGARDFGAIADYMDEMARLLDERYAQHNAGLSDFQDLTVAIDEMPAIVSEVGKEIATVWRQWLREGRKVGLFLAAATHSTRVKTLGIEGEGDLLENFYCVVVLGKLAETEYPDLMPEWRQGLAVVRTVGGARAVRVPHVPAGNGNGNGHRQQGQAQVVAPKPKSLETEYGTVTPMQITRILQLKEAGWSNSRIETSVFDQENAGGAAYYKVKAVLDAFYEKEGIPASVE